MAKRFSVVEFIGDEIISTPVDTYDDGVRLFIQKFYDETLLDEFVIVDETTGEVIFIGSEVCAR